MGKKYDRDLKTIYAISKMDFTVDYCKDNIIKSIAALANAEGGTLYVTRANKTKQNPDYDFNNEEVENCVAMLNTIKDQSLPNTFSPIKDYLTIDKEEISEGKYYAKITIPEYNDSLIVITKNENANNNNGDANNTTSVVYINTKEKIVEYRIEDILSKDWPKATKLLLGTSFGKPDGNLRQYNTKGCDVLYKYMSVDSFIQSMYRKTWYFVEPTKWADKYEGRFYNANYKNFNFKPKRLYATCLTPNEADEASWKVYASGSGLGCHCVQLKIKADVLRKKLRQGVQKVENNNKISFPCNVFEAGVIYNLTNEQIDNLHKKKGEFHSKFFDDFGLEKFLKLLLLKRKAYTHEQETRLFLVPEKEEDIDPNYPKHLEISIEWKEIIKDIFIDKKCSTGELYAIQSACKAAGLDCTEIMNNDQNYKNYNGKPIPLVLFDIDEMKGGNITIQN